MLLPVLALLMVMSIDFGRVFFGWVGLQNAARIAANEAGFSPGAWTGAGDAGEQARYRQTVLNDMQAINCAPPGGGTWDVSDIPDPTWADAGGTAATNEIGDYAVVDLSCTFTFLTPLVESLLGSDISIGAHAEFPIRGGLIEDTPVATAAPTPTPVPTATPEPTLPLPSIELDCTAPELIGKTVSTGQLLWNTAGFTGSYSIVQPPYNNYTVGAQSLVGGQDYPCTSSITVSRQ